MVGKLRRFRFLLVYTMAAGTVLLILGLANPAYASLYGRGSYSGCSYQDCPQSPSPTIMTTPTGLQVSINLTTGQNIPLTGYTIIITPINGRGSSFKQADIYVGGLLMHTAVPDQTGTAQWFWAPTSTGSTDIKVIVTDTNGATTTQQFTVHVEATSPTENRHKPSSTAPTKASGVAGFVQSIASGAEHAAKAAVDLATNGVKALPAPVIHTFPYILFILLAADAILLLVRAEGELHEYRKLQAILARARLLAEAKRTFIELTSHYLRTPLTILLGGVELLSLDKTLVSSDVLDLSKVTQHMRQTVEGLIQQVKVIDEQTTANDARIDTNPTPIWRHAGLLLPILLIAVLWLCFEYLVKRARTFSVGQIELAIQTIVFTIVVLGLYQIFRYRQLRRRDKRQLERVVAEEVRIGEARDTLIVNTVAALGSDLRSLDTLVAELNASTAVRSIQSGQQRFNEVFDKFAVATRLRGAQSEAPFTSVAFDSLLAAAKETARRKAEARGISIGQSANMLLPTQELALLTFVLSSLLDNAVAYSPDKASVVVSASLTPSIMTITVTDHGSGVPANKLPLLFQPFSKIEGAEVFTHEGMGFSLYLDKLIMTYLGGDIQLSSAPHKGTVATLRLPVSTLSAPVSDGGRASGAA